MRNRSPWLRTAAALCVLAIASTPAHALRVVDQQLDLVSLVDGAAAQQSELTIERGGLSFRADSGPRRIVFSSGPIEAPFPFTALGGYWWAHGPPGTSLEIYLSTSADGVVFGDFLLLQNDPHLEPTRTFADGSLNPHFGAVLGALALRPQSDGRFYRVRVVLARDPGVTATPRLLRLGFTIIDSSEQHVDPLAGRVRSAVDRTIDADYPRPPVASREQWGAQPPICQYDYCATTHIAVHHTAGVGDYPCQGFDECGAVVRAIQAFHMNTNGWCDIGYNYLVGADGSLFEGRGGGDDVRAAHDGFNCGSMGVANLGYFHPPFNQLWTGAQSSAVAELAAWKSDARGIDPYGIDFYAGLGADMETLYGHRDVSATACPGDGVYAFLPDLRSDVNDRLVNGPREWLFDNAAADAVTGGWITGTSSPDKFGADYLFASSGSGEVCAWTLAVAAPGHYELSFWWPEGGNRSTAARLFVKRPLPTPLVLVDQTVNGGHWNIVGHYLLPAGKAVIGVANEGVPGTVVICDAIRLRPLH